MVFMDKNDPDLIDESSVKATSYVELAQEGFAEIKVKKSRFLAYAFPIADEEDFFQRLESIRKEHNKARHHCWAFRLGESFELERLSDDGEPSGTAGSPIMGQLKSKELTNAGIVVVRYFGGILLGTSGLIQAYKQSAMESVANVETKSKNVMMDIALSCPYNEYGWVQNQASKLGAYISSQTMGEGCDLVVSVPIMSHNALYKTLRANHKLAMGGGGKEG